MFLSDTMSSQTLNAVTDDFESAKSHKTNSSCKTQLQRELLAYESMEIITLATYQLTRILALTLDEYTQISFFSKSLAQQLFITN